MKVLHLSSEYPPQKVFGLGRFVYDLAGAQTAQGDDACVVTNSLSGDRHEITERGVRVCRVHWPPPPKPVDESATVMQFNVQLLERAMPVLEDWKPEVINVHDWLTAAAGKSLKRIYGIPLVMTVHDTVMGKSFGQLDNEKKFIGRIEEWIARRADRVIANSNWVKGEMVETYRALPEKVDVVPCAADASAFDIDVSPDHRAAFRSVLAAPDERIVLYTGRLDHEKGLEVVMNAIPLVLAKFPKVKFVLAGKGKMRPTLEEHLKKNNLTDRVLFAGYVLPPALAHLYHAADVHMVPSTYEPFGIVALEGMVCGKPIVASRTGGLADIVQHRKTGLLVEPRSHEQLAEALVQMLIDPDRCDRFGRAGRQRAVEVFNWQHVAELTDKVYRRAIEEPMAGMAQPPRRPEPRLEPIPEVRSVEKTGPRILFDCQQLGPEMDGVGNYTERVLRAMLALDRELEWVLLCHSGNADYVEALIGGHPGARRIVLEKPVPLDYRVQQDMLSKIIPAEGVGLFFSPCFMSVPRELVPTVSVVHDVSYEVRPELFPKGFAEYMRACVGDSCRNALHIITVSENSRADIGKAHGVEPERISVIPLAADACFFGPADPDEVDAVREKYDLPGAYVLAVNVGSGKKNFSMLLNAFGRIAPEARQGVKLVAVGKWDPREVDLQAAARDAGLCDDVVLTGHVPLNELCALYAGAQIFCFPSIHEGFGLPVLEAMAAGTPVISSSAASLPEVAGDAAVLLDPGNELAWSGAIERLLSSPKERDALSRKGWQRVGQFDWQKTGEATLAVIRDALVAADRMKPVQAGSAPPVFEPVAFSGPACAITVDDVRPEPGFGGNREKGPLGLLLKLHEEFGARFTLFVPTNWRGKWPLEEHAEWLKWLLVQPCFEVASHGHEHDMGGGPWEFKRRTPEELAEVLDACRAAFAVAGHSPRGVKAPGWLLEPSAYDVFDQCFDYVADHVEGTQPFKLKGGALLRMPYTYTIDRLGSWPERGLTVLQSHAAHEGSTTNGWNAEFYEKMQAYLATGKRLGVEFVTLGEVADRLSSAQDAPEDTRLHGGQVKVLDSEAGVLYGAAGGVCPLRLRPENATIAILSRNRWKYLADLLRSIDETSPDELGRVVLLNNCEDDSAPYLAEHFPNWRLVELNDADFREEPAGLQWLKGKAPELLPQPVEKLGVAAGWTAPRSIGWLRNRQWVECGRDFLISFDDDYVVKPGWWEYYIRFQNEFGAHAVINNFGAFVMARTVPERIGAYDERFLGSHGYEDNDYSARIAEAGLRWVLGFNREHDWRSAEEGNPRGSGTGADYFIHRYALASGGYAAKRDEARKDSVRAAWNARWWAAKWQETREDTGIFARPPFKGVFLKRDIIEEPKWLASLKTPAAITAAPGVKTSENTPVAEIDPVANPNTGTMIDRYSFAAHWCKGKRVLDAACGHGYGSTFLLGLGAESVLGVDTDPDALAYAEDHYSGKRVSFRHFDLTSSEDSLGQFDAVVSIETMEHLPREKVEAYLACLKAHAAPGGTVLITTPRRTTAEWQYRGGTHRYEYSHEEFDQLIESTFTRARVKYWGIEEFRRPRDARLHSSAREGIDEKTRIMVAVVEGVS